MNLVGRETELTRLRDELALASRGQKRAIILEGDVGIGKTALVERFLESECEGWRVHRHSFGGSQRGSPMSELVRLAGDLGAGEAPAEWTRLDEVFLLSRDGLLIHHGGAGGAVDEDVLGSMLSAVQDFVRDSFGDGDRSGGLNELAYKGLHILIEHGKSVFMACVVSKGAHPSMRDDVRRALSKIEAEHGQRLAPWDGDISSLVGVPEIIDNLLRAKFPRVGLTGEEALAHQNLRFEWLRRAVEAAMTEPHVVFLDDLQEADPTSIRAIGYLLRGLGNGPLLLLMARRPGTGDKTGEEAIGKLAEEGFAERWVLGPVSAANTKTIMGQILKGAEVPDGLAAEIHTAVQGVPSEIVGLTSLLVKTGRIVSVGGIWAVKGRRSDWWARKSDTASKMLEDLDPDTLALLEMCSVISARAEKPLLAKGLDWPLAKLDGRLGLAKEQGLVLESGGRVVFKNAHFERVLRDGMGPLRLALWHRTSARVLLGENAGAVPVFAVAEHLALGHVPEPGIDYCIRAGELAEAEYAFPEAVKYLEWAVELIERRGDDPRLLGTLEHLTRVLDTNGDFAGEISCLDKLMGIEGLENGSRAEAARRLGVAHLSQGSAKEANRYFEEALALLGDSPKDLEKGRIKKDIAKLKLKEAPAEALALDEDYLRAAESLGSQGDIAQACLAIGGAYFYLKKADDAVVSWSRAAEIFASLNDDFGLSDTMLNLGAAYSVKADAARSEEALEKAVQIKERIGDFRRLSAALNNLGIAYSRRGDTERAIETHRRCLEIRLRIGDALGMAKSHNALGVAYGQMGRHGEAVASYSKELSIMMRHGDTAGTAQAHANLSETYCAMELYSDAERHADLALSIAQQKKLLEQEKIALVTKAHVRSRKGDWAKSKETFDQAVQLSAALGEPRTLGMTHLEYGEEGARNGDPDARKHIELALEMLERAGAKPQAQKARAMLEKMGK
ncbi:MAG: tetratricopeptide repeat protein [Methanobacteriota archaeon]